MTQRQKLTGSPLSSRVAQWTQPGFIKAIQRGVIQITGATSTATGTITAVDVSNARLRLVGWRCTAVGNADIAMPRIVLTNSTTITAVVSANPGADATTVSYEITEYWPGVIKSVQRGTIAGISTATITTVNTAKAELDWLGCSSNDAATSYTFSTSMVLTNATTVTTLAGAAATQTTGFQVVEFY